MKDQIKLRILQKRGKAKHRVGVLIGIKLAENKIGIGFSLCAKGDTYSEEKAMLIATNRAKSSFNRPLHLPHSIKNDYSTFVNKCSKYFKSDSLNEYPSVWINDPSINDSKLQVPETNAAARVHSYLDALERMEDHTDNNMKIDEMISVMRNPLNMLNEGK